MKRRPLIYVVATAPAAALECTGTEKAVLVAMIGCMNYKANGYAVWPSSETLASWSGFSSKTAKRARERLREIGLIKIQNDRGRVPVCIIQEHTIRNLAAGATRDTVSAPPRSEQVSSESQRQLPIHDVVAGVAGRKTINRSEKESHKWTTNTEKSKAIAS